MSFLNPFKKKSETPKDPPIIRNAPVTLMVKLLFDEKVVPDHPKLATELKKQFSRFDSEGDAEKPRQYFLRDYVVDYDEGILPAQCVIFVPQGNEAIAKQLEKAYQQKWHWDDAQEQTKTCQFELVITELLNLPLAYQKRVECFQKFLYAACKALKPKALYFIQSEKVVETQSYLKQLDEGGMLALYALLNVRLFNLPDKDHYMDSLGLYALGLPDLQIRFNTYEPNDIAPVLYSLAQYIFDEGSVILHGNTVEGVEAGSRWECHYQKAGIKPERNVLHIYPGTKSDEQKA